MSNYIALELKVIEVLAPQAARASGVHEDRVIAGLVRLYHRSWSLRSDRVSKLQLAGLFGGEALETLITALAEGGLLEAGEADWRVKGADRYLRLHEARSKGGKAAAGNLKRGSNRPAAQPESQPGALPELKPGALPAGPRLEPGNSPGSFPALTPSTEHRTPNRKEEEDPPPPAGFVRKLVIHEPAPTPPRTDVETGPVAYQEPTTPPDTWVGEDFFAWAQARRQRAGLVGERRRPRNLGTWWSTCLMTPGVTVERMREAFLAFGDSTHWQAATPPLPFAAFMAQWDQFLPREVRHAS
ncbi:MAG: hypothetical protein JNJ54_35165 [Myxococcaceae bacterium]|nr:hypothetical protein [Myxococcaceae bacterium]